MRPGDLGDAFVPGSRVPSQKLGTCDCGRQEGGRSEESLQALPTVTGALNPRGARPVFSQGFRYEGPGGSLAPQAVGDAQPVSCAAQSQRAEEAPTPCNRPLSLFSVLQSRACRTISARPR